MIYTKKYNKCTMGGWEIIASFSTTNRSLSSHSSLSRNSGDSGNCRRWSHIAGHDADNGRRVAAEMAEGYLRKQNWLLLSLMLHPHWCWAHNRRRLSSYRRTAAPSPSRWTLSQCHSQFACAWICSGDSGTISSPGSGRDSNGWRDVHVQVPTDTAADGICVRVPAPGPARREFAVSSSTATFHSSATHIARRSPIANYCSLLWGEGKSAKINNN